MGHIFQPGRIVRDEHGRPVLDARGKPTRELRSKNWFIRYYDADGRAHDESSGSTKIGVAKALLADRESAKHKGEPVGTRIGKVTFEDAATDIVNDYKTNGRRSLAHVERRIAKHLRPAFGGRRLAGITTADIRAFTVQRQAPVPHEDGTETPGASAAEINRELAVLKRMFTLAVQAGKLLHRPYIPMLKERNVRTGFFERAEFEAVRAALPVWLRPVVTFAYLTGWRMMSEILPLRLRQVDLTADIVRLDAGTTKNDEARTFAFQGLTELRDMLVAQVKSGERLSRQTDRVISHVFHQPEGSPIAEHDLRQAWKSACTAAGLPGKIPHDFRRTAVRNLVRAGVPERVAMTMTGHKTRSVFDRYNIVAGSDQREAAEKLQAFLTAPPATAPVGRIRPFMKRARRATG